MTRLQSRWRWRLGALGRAAGAFIATLASAGAAHADESSFALSWRSSASKACVTEDALRDAVERKLGRRPFVSPVDARIVIEGVESPPSNDRYRAQVTQRDRTGLLGTRELEASSCPGLLRAATLVVALIVDPDGTGSPTATSLSPSAPDDEGGTDGRESGPDVAPRTSEGTIEPRRGKGSNRRKSARPRRPVSSLPPPSTFEWSGGLGIGTTIGVLPSPALTLSALGRLTMPRSRWSFDFRVGYSTSQTLEAGAVRGEFSAIEQQWRACFAFVRWPVLRTEACGGIAWGAVLPRTTGVSRGDDHPRVLLGPTVALGVELHRADRPKGAVAAPAARLDVGLTLPARAYAFTYVDTENRPNSLYSTDGVLFVASLSGLATIF